MKSRNVRTRPLKNTEWSVKRKGKEGDSMLFVNQNSGIRILHVVRLCEERGGILNLKIGEEH